MLARLQQFVVAAVLLAALAWAAVAWQRGHPLLAALGAAAIVLAPSALLALEFALAHWINRHDRAPRATLGQCVVAWARETVTAFRVFGWAQPFRSTAQPDHLPASDRVGVLLVHGFACNRGLWNPWVVRLRALDVPVVAVNLEPVFGTIDDYAPVLNAAVERLRAATGRAPVIVAHSMGGLAVRIWLATQADVRRCACHVVTIGSPHAGTWLARFAYSANGRQMRLQGRWLAALMERERSLTHRLPFTCFYSPCDNIVFPASTAMLPAADNRLVAGAAHVDMVFHPEVFEVVLELQRRRSAAPVSLG